jgi:hypothetical protein
VRAELLHLVLEKNVWWRGVRVLAPGSSGDSERPDREFVRCVGAAVWGRFVAAIGPHGAETARIFAPARNVRRNVVFLCLLAAGVALRLLVTLAYQPARLWFDSIAYLRDSRDLVPRAVLPLGYGAFLRVVVSVADLAAVPVVQHLMGLLIAGLLYAVLVRLRVPRAVAALGAAPVLLDAYQVAVEEIVLSETLFELLVVGACALLLWRPRPRVAAAAGAGVLLGLAGVTRSVGVALIVPALVAVVALAPRRPWPALALAVGFAVPLGGYAALYHHDQGRYALTGASGRFLYGRVAQVADCAQLDLSRAERVLCPPEPLGHRAPPGHYLWSRSSPLQRVPRDQRERLAGRFARKVIRQQPLDYAGVVALDSFKAFAPTGVLHHNDAPTVWRFTSTALFGASGTLHRYGYDHVRVRPRLIRALAGYQRLVYVWGPLLAALLVVSLFALADASTRAAACMFSGSALTLLVVPAAVSEFTWRYRVPVVMLLPPAAALGATALSRRVRDTRRHGPAAQSSRE